ncbi:MAG: HRDC domain-containing protein [Planctomycetes bacterium]|nr:HRDC domain-containing protein [Planctomycetota bacterium]
MEGDGGAMEELNVFLRTHRVLSVDKVAVMDQGRHYWSVYVEYLARKSALGGGATSGSSVVSNRPRVDYREELTKPEFERFSLLRDLRKLVAAREAVPVYALFTNAQLADFARKVPQSKAALGKVDGVGDAKMDKYGDEFLTLLKGVPGPEKGSDEKEGGAGETTREAGVEVAGAGNGAAR